MLEIDGGCDTLSIVNLPGKDKTMDNFIFSVNVTIPIFLIILLGYILRRIHFLTDEFVRVANK